MRSLASSLAMLALGLGACGGSKPVTASRVVAPSPHPTSSAVTNAPVHVLARSTVRAAVALGLGAFLQHVDLDERPVLVGGKFHGFRIAALRDAPFWSEVDLKAGDVVTLLNGLPIERPEQAQRAFESLEVSGELRVSYERDKEPREIVYLIVDDR